MSFISANVLSMKRSTREPVPPSEAGGLQTRSRRHQRLQSAVAQDGFHFQI